MLKCILHREMLQTGEGSAVIQIPHPIPGADPQPVSVLQQAVDAIHAAQLDALQRGGGLEHAAVIQFRALGPEIDISAARRIRVDDLGIEAGLRQRPPLHDFPVPEQEVALVPDDAVDIACPVARDGEDVFAPEALVRQLADLPVSVQEEEAGAGGHQDVPVFLLAEAPHGGIQAFLRPVHRQAPAVQADSPHFAGAHPKSAPRIRKQAHGAGDALHCLESAPVKAGQAAVAADIEEAVWRLNGEVRFGKGHARSVVIDRGGIRLPDASGGSRSHGQREKQEERRDHCAACSEHLLMHPAPPFRRPAHDRAARAW